MWRLPGATEMQVGGSFWVFFVFFWYFFGFSWGVTFSMR